MERLFGSRNTEEVEAWKKEAEHPQPLPGQNAMQEGLAEIAKADPSIGGQAAEKTRLEVDSLRAKVKGDLVPPEAEGTQDGAIGEPQSVSHKPEEPHANPTPEARNAA
jgi:hypothetical protein